MKRFVELQKKADARVVLATMRGVELARQIQEQLRKEELENTCLKRR